MAIEASTVAESRCTCTHSINAHGLNGDAGCAFCQCARFTRPAVAKTDVELSKYANSALELLTKTPSLKAIEKDALVAFVKDGHGRMFAAGSYLARRGERSHNVHVVLSGGVYVEPKDEQGKGHELGAGEIAGDLRAFTDEPRWASIYATGSTMALEVDASTLKPTFAEHPEFFMALVQNLGKFSDNADEVISATVQAALEQQTVDQAVQQREGLDPAKAMEIAARWRMLKDEDKAAADLAREAARKAVESQTSRGR
jgi:CRP-like cAMP-binding protein